MIEIKTLVAIVVLMLMAIVYYAGKVNEGLKCELEAAKRYREPNLIDGTRLIEWLNGFTENYEDIDYPTPGDTIRKIESLMKEGDAE